MNITSSTSLPTNPYHIARAYGLPNARPPQSTQATQAAAASTPVSAVEPVQELRIAGQVEPIQRIVGGGSKAYNPEVQGLVAGTVPGGVDFHADGSASPTGGADGHGGSLPFYRHPADRNSAATAVTVGRSLDISA